VARTQSERSQADAQAPLGRGTTRTLERVMAAVGMLQGAPLEFEPAEDVPHGGVLCALPALLMFGLLRHSRQTFSLAEGFYPLEIFFLGLALLALGRVKSLEGLRFEPPGEWGKLLGMDRIPEVKTFREKLDQLCQESGRVQGWSSTLAREWMEASSQSVGTFYIDGHVRVYHGELTPLPRRYVARERLCLRGTTDYWVNAMDGQPFFVVTQPVDPGLGKVILEQIVPRLLQDLPGQPSAAELEADPWRVRFVLVFDREAYSPQLFADLKALRIGILTYHKFPGEAWAPEEFTRRPVKLVNGEEVELDLAERGTRLSNGLWVREIRHRESNGHQTSLLATDYQRSLDRAAVALFARWCQENFFKYMNQHYGLDRLIEYGTQPLPETTKVVNPAWRRLENQVQQQVRLLQKEQSQWGAMQVPVDASSEQTQAMVEKSASLLASLQERQKQVADLKAQRKLTPRHVLLKDLPETERFAQLRTDKKHFVDTIKLIAYRAETALALLVREKLSHKDEARALVRHILDSAMDLRPDPEKKTLTVRLHRLTTAGQDHVLEYLCEELTATETVYPGTELRLIYEVIPVEGDKVGLAK
jgi:hypothetical protein